MSFILTIVEAGMFFFVFPRRYQVASGQLMSCYYLTLTLWQIDQTLRYSLAPSAIGTLPYQLTTAFVFSLVFGLMEVTYIQFLYQFLHNPFKRESRIVLTISLFAALGLLILNIWNEFFNHSDLTVLQLGGFGYGLLANFWVLIVCWRKARNLRSRNAQAARAFSILTLINVGYVATSVVSVVFGFYSPVGYWTYFLTVWAGDLIQVIIYISYAAVPTNFQIKISAYSFVTVVTFLTVVTLVFFPPVLPDDLPTRMAQQEGLAKMFAIIAGATLFVVLVLPRILRNSLTMPLQQVLAGVQRVNAGDLTTSVAVGTPDEIGVLAQNFNQMTQSLRHAKDELTAYAQTLENKVLERTAELNQKSMALEQSLTDLKETQAQLIQKEKMASLGELTAGVAHEIQNPLNFVSNFSEISMELLDELKEGPIKQLLGPDRQYVDEVIDDLAENLEKIIHHGRRADGIVKGMLEHSRSSKGERQITDLNALADEFLRLAYHGLRAKDKEFNATLITDFDPHLEKFAFVPQDIGRVMLNLCNNAFYAVHEKAKQLSSSYQPQVNISTHRVNGWVELRVKDNGMGIPEYVRQKIFQPFFTTKPTGQGTGLGLSLCFDIVTKGHGGEMNVATEVGEFTEMIVRLPIKKAPLNEEALL